MKKGFAWPVVVGGCAVLLAGPAMAQRVWTHEATSDHVFGGGVSPAPCYIGAACMLSDANRIKVSSMVVDAQGNVYAATNNSENYRPASGAWATAASGGVTLFKPDGAGGWNRIHINLINATPGAVNPGEYPGAITKLVIAADGKCYALQNFTEINWGTGRAYDQRILQLDADGNVQQIFNASDEAVAHGFTVNRDADQIKGLTIGGDGLAYWTMSGSDNHDWRHNFLYRYNHQSGQVEPSPMNGQPDDNGWGIGDNRFYDFEYVGGGYFAVVYAKGKLVSAIAWDKPRMGVFNNGNDSQWGIDRTTSLAYDPLHRRLWHAPRGQSASCIMMRWNGGEWNPGMFTDETADNNGFENRKGIENFDVWHANGNDGSLNNPPNGAKYWISAMAIDPADGAAWMTWNADNYPPGNINYTYNGTYGPIGGVYAVGWHEVGPNPDGSGVQGAPRENAIVMALAFDGRGRVYALTVDHAGATPGAWNLYSSGVPAPTQGACCTTDKHNPCVEASESACGGQYDGVWRGADTTCAAEADTCWQDVCYEPAVDKDGDGDVDSTDFAIFQACVTNGSTTSTVSDEPVKCSCFDNSDGMGGGADGKVTMSDDFGPFTLCGSGPGVPTPCE